MMNFWEKRENQCTSENLTPSTRDWIDRPNWYQKNFSSLLTLPLGSLETYFLKLPLSCKLLVFNFMSDDEHLNVFENIHIDWIYELKDHSGKLKSNTYYNFDFRDKIEFV